MKKFAEVLRNPYFAPVLTIYAPMIYTAPCIKFWMRAYPLHGEVGGGRGLGPGILEFFGPCEMGTSR
jgi:hypothetical protein